MIGAWVGLTISALAFGFGVVQLRRGEQNGKLAIALGALGMALNLYALFLS